MKVEELMKQDPQFIAGYRTRTLEEDLTISPRVPNKSRSEIMKENWRKRKEAQAQQLTVN